MTYQKLREALIEAYISIVHSQQDHQDSEFEKLTSQAYSYLVALVQKPDAQFGNEILVQIMELFSDIVAVFGKKSESGPRNNSLIEQIRCNGLEMT